VADRIDPAQARADLDVAITAGLPISGGLVRKRLKQLRRALADVPERQLGAWKDAVPYRIYSRWVCAQDRSGRAVYRAIKEAYKAGREEATPGGTDG
jgi:hypothetical protein